MRRAIAIPFALFAFVIAYIAVRVCIVLVPRIHQNIANSDPTMLFSRYRLEGWHGYFVPVGVGVFAIVCTLAGIYLLLLCRRTK